MGGGSEKDSRGKARLEAATCCVNPFPVSTSSLYSNLRYYHIIVQL